MYIQTVTGSYMFLVMNKKGIAFCSDCKEMGIWLSLPHTSDAVCLLSSSQGKQIAMCLSKYSSWPKQDILFSWQALPICGKLMFYLEAHLVFVKLWVFSRLITCGSWRWPAGAHHKPNILMNWSVLHLLYKPAFPYCWDGHGSRGREKNTFSFL